ncbi:MAG: hypothetical protein ACRECD_01230 [Burkholderiaceae bacterium]
MTELMPESLNDALIECVKAAGGSKLVGHKLFPEKLVDAAQRHLLNCLQEGRAEHLKPEQMLLICRLAREVGCHAGMAYMAHALGYAPPIPVEPRDEVAELQRQFVEATKQMAAMAARLQQLQPLQPQAERVLKVAA